MSDDANKPHGVWKMVCRMCAHKWVAVAPVGVDEDTMECPSCGHMTGEPEDDAADDG